MRSLIIILIAAIVAIPTTLIFHTTHSAEIQYRKGHALFTQGEHAASIPYFNRSLAKNPRHIGALTDQAYAYAWTGEFTKAIVNFEKVLSLRPSDPHVIRSLAEVCIWNGQYDKAIGILRPFTQTYPQDQKAQLLLANALHYSGKTQEASEIYEQLLGYKNSSNKGKDTRQLLAETYMSKGDHDNAIKLYKEILHDDPANIQARISLADMLSWQRKYDQAIREYSAVLSRDPDNMRALIQCARVYVWNADYPRAKELCARILKRDPGNLEAKEILADAYAYNKEFNTAIRLYKELLRAHYSRTVKEKMADTLSWNKQYREALTVYDELFAEKDEASLRVKKARILGWAKRYPQALEEYKRSLALKDDEMVRLEMRAKEAYWGERVKRAISLYRSLIDRVPENAEARFDLSQIYSYQSMWNEAIDQYVKILKRYPNHFRAQEGLKKVRLMQKRAEIESGYEFFEADSSSRDSDVKKHTFFNKLNVPLNERLNLNVLYSLARRIFSDFKNTTENTSGIGFSYRNNPFWKVAGFFRHTEPYQTMHPVNEWGTWFGFRIFDFGESEVSYQRERLENNSTVIRNAYYRDAYTTSVEIYAHRKISAGSGYAFYHYSDGNYMNEPNVFIMYYFSREPKLFSVKYTYFFRDFHKQMAAYFSPNNFSTHRLSINWRHYLNKEEIFFGANDLYYDLRYDISVDSEDIVGHTFTGSLAWDINKRLRLKLEGQYAHSSADIYEDKRATASMQYYF